MFLHISSQDAQPTISSPHIPPASGPAMVAAMTTGLIDLSLKMSIDSNGRSSEYKHKSPKILNIIKNEFYK